MNLTDFGKIMEGSNLILCSSFMDMESGAKIKIFFVPPESPGGDGSFFVGVKFDPKTHQLHTFPRVFASKEEALNHYNNTRRYDKDLIKRNIIRLVEHHKRTCDGPDCNISLMLVRDLVELAGIELSEEERREFM